MAKFKKVLLILFLLSLAARLYFLFFGISSITNDEADYYMSSYLLAKTGSDQYGHVLFLSSGFLNAISSVPVYIGALFFKIIPIKNVLFARLPFALLNSFTPVLFFSLIYFFSSNLLFSMLGFGVMSFSPWFSHLSATAAFDSPIALLFFFAAMNVFCYLEKPAWLKYGLFVLFNFLAFNSYMGFKTIFPFLLLLFLLLYFYSQKNTISKKQVVFSALFTAILFLSLFALSLKGPGSDLFVGRASKTIVFLNKNLLENQVWYARLTTNNRIVRKMFDNTLVASMQMFVSKYANALNPGIYFFGEPHVIYGLRIMGLFFATDFIIFLIGLFYGFHLLDKKLKILIIGLLCIGPIPAALQIEGLTVALRGIFLLPSLSLIIASGYFFLIKKIQNKSFLYVLFFLFVFNFVSFLALYQFRIKILSSESWSMSQKIVATDLYNYKNSKVNVYVKETEPFPLLYGMYNDIDNPQLLKKTLMNVTGKKYIYENLTVHFSCDDLLTQKNEGYILLEVKKCPKEYQAKKMHLKTIKEYYGQDKTGDLIYILTEIN